MSTRSWISGLAALAVLLLAPREVTRGQAQPSTQPIPLNVLEQIHRHELGDRYDPALAQKYVHANQLLERFFAEPAARKQVLAAIEALGLDPDIVGRLARIRIWWQDLTGGVYYINERVGTHDAHYFLGIPKDYDRTKPWPLVIKLPTADAFVTNPPPDADQVKSIYTGWVTEELSRHPDAVVIMPLLHLDQLWGPSYRGMGYVMAPLWDVAERVNIDPVRVYLVGHSMSAHATWNLALHYTTYFASFQALAGGCKADWQRVRLMNLRNVLPVIWHDANDRVIKVDSSRQPVQILRRFKAPVEYDETRGVGHVPTDEIAQRTYARMRERTRDLYPKSVSLQSTRPDTMFNRNDWVQVYQPINPGDEKRLAVARATGFMIVHDKPWKVDATIANNRIDATADNVQTMRFYLNDQMIDFDRAVTVVVNRRGRFEALVKPSAEEMLKDQLFLGRGWRYYTAVIDIDLAPRRGSATTQPSGE